MVRQKSSLAISELPQKDSSVVAVIDIGTIQQLIELSGPESANSFLNDLIETFVKNSSVVASQLVSSLEANKPSDITILAHKLKGFSINLGAARLVELCDTIENRQHTIPSELRAGWCKSVKACLLEAVAELRKLQTDSFGGRRDALSKK